MAEYRDLEPGEIIAKTDEWWDDDDGTWNPCDASVGERYSTVDSFIVRRQIAPAAGPLPDAPERTQA